MGDSSGNNRGPNADELAAALMANDQFKSFLLTAIQSAVGAREPAPTPATPEGERVQTPTVVLDQGIEEGIAGAVEGDRQSRQNHAETETEKRMAEKCAEMEAVLSKFKQMAEAGGLSGFAEKEANEADPELLPPNFRMPTLPPYKGTGPPRVHVENYYNVMRMQGLTNNQMASLFPCTLEGAAAEWLSVQSNEVRSSWDNLSKAFVEHYGYNTKTKTTLQDLEAVRQKPNESFQKYYERWMATQVLLAKKPSSDELIVKLIDGALPLYKEKMELDDYETFEDVYKKAKKIERQMEARKTESGAGSSYKKTYQPGQWDSYANTSGNKNRPLQDTKTTEVAAVTQGQPPQNVQHVKKTVSPYIEPMSRIFEKCKKVGLLQNMKPYEAPAEADKDRFCAYHVEVGHHTDNCYKLRAAIWQLVKDGKIQEPPLKPNVQSNPLPVFGGQSSATK